MKVMTKEEFDSIFRTVGTMAMVVSGKYGLVSGDIYVLHGNVAVNTVSRYPEGGFKLPYPHAIRIMSEVDKVKLIMESYEA